MVPIRLQRVNTCRDGEPMVGYQATETLAEGYSEADAIANLRTFQGCGDNWNGLNDSQKAQIDFFTIDESRSSNKVLFCERRFNNSEGDYTCGRVTGEFGNRGGELGMCVIGGYDTPEWEGCPYK